MNTYRASSAHGRVHSMTEGRQFTLYGTKYTNSSRYAFGKADCGPIVSGGAGHLTDAPVNCPRCIATNSR